MRGAFVKKLHLLLRPSSSLNPYMILFSARHHRCCEEGGGRGGYQGTEPMKAQFFWPLLRQLIYIIITKRGEDHQGQKCPRN